MKTFSLDLQMGTLVFQKAQGASADCAGWNFKKITYSFFFFFGITIQETSEGLKSESQEHTLR